MTALAAALAAAYVLSKTDPARPAFVPADGGLALVEDAALLFGAADVALPARMVQLPELVAGTSYFIRVGDGVLVAVAADDLPDATDIGGFICAPGGNATARAGGDSVAQIDPASVWDVAFRPSCADPRGMVLVSNSPAMPGLAPFWFDKNLLAQDHLAGTSRYGAVIADGENLPDRVDGKGRYGKCDFETAKAIAAHHGKSLPSYVEYVAGAYGGKERTSADERHETSVLVPQLSSRYLNQAFGERWVWGTDGDPDDPRAALFGGSWISGSDAGSRCASLVYWPESSGGGIGVRLRSDHLQLA